MHHDREDKKSDPNSRHRNHEDADERMPNDFNDAYNDEYRDEQIDEEDEPLDEEDEHMEDEDYMDE